MEGEPCKDTPPATRRRRWSICSRRFHVVASKDQAKGKLGRMRRCFRKTLRARSAAFVNRLRACTSLRSVRLQFGVGRWCGANIVAFLVTGERNGSCHSHAHHPPTSPTRFQLSSRLKPRVMQSLTTLCIQANAPKVLL